MATCDVEQTESFGSQAGEVVRKYTCPRSDCCMDFNVRPKTTRNVYPISTEGLNKARKERLTEKDGISKECQRRQQARLN